MQNNTTKLQSILKKTDSQNGDSMNHYTVPLKGLENNDNLSPVKVENIDLRRYSKDIINSEPGNKFIVKLKDEINKPTSKINSENKLFIDNNAMENIEIKASPKENQKNAQENNIAEAESKYRLTSDSNVWKNKKVLMMNSMPIYRNKVTPSQNQDQQNQNNIRPKKNSLTLHTRATSYNFYEVEPPNEQDKSDFFRVERLREDSLTKQSEKSQNAEPKKLKHSNTNSMFSLPNSGSQNSISSNKAASCKFKIRKNSIDLGHEKVQTSNHNISNHLKD